MRREILTILTTLTASSAEYKKALKEASNLELVNAVTKMYGKSGTKAKIAACDKELRMRGKGAEKNEKN
ncbi:MAG: hypothetical protein NC120_13800 [Ruminococcus sp.]|nr:hypothetical protein [Ruminococcus sp.]